MPTVNITLHNLDREELRLLIAALRDKHAQVQETLQAHLDKKESLQTDFVGDGRPDTRQVLETHAQKLMQRMHRLKIAYSSFPPDADAEVTFEYCKDASQTL